MLDCRGLAAGYGSHAVVSGVDLSVASGEVVGLLGTNGAGKSTLLRAIAQLIPALAGEVIVDGGALAGIAPAEAARRGVVHVAGGAGVFPSLTVAEHFLTASFLCADRTTAERRAAAAVDAFPALEQWWRRRAGQLSGGEQQQLAIALTLLAEPKVLLVDELSLGLATGALADVAALVRSVAARGCAVLVVEQSIDVARRIVDRAYFMEQGEIRFTGTPAQLAKRADLIRPVFLTAPPAPAMPASTGGAALRVRSLTKHFGGIAAVDDVSLEVAANSIVGVIGPNGAGKTTLLDLVSGFVRPDSGSVNLDDTDLTSLAPHRRARCGLGRTFQDAALFPALTVAEAVAVAFETHPEARDHRASVEPLLELLELTDLAERRMDALSTGTRRIVELAMALAHAPRVLLLDEPAAGLAHAEVDALAARLPALRDELGCSLLVVEHDFRFISAVADRLTALDNGRVLADGAPREVLDDPAVVAAFLGTKARRRRGRNP
jgi:branched-chain amino acid transport system ATP-binding protein